MNDSSIYFGLLYPNQRRDVEKFEKAFQAKIIVVTWRTRDIIIYYLKRHIYQPAFISVKRDEIYLF